MSKFIFQWHPSGAVNTVTIANCEIEMTIQAHGLNEALRILSIVTGNAMHWHLVGNW